MIDVSPVMSAPEQTTAACARHRYALMETLHAFITMIVTSRQRFKASKEAATAKITAQWASNEQ